MVMTWIIPRSCAGWLLVSLAVVAAGCSAKSEPAASNAAPVTDNAYLTGAIWDDGQAEIAFYQVNRTVDQAGQPSDQQFTMGTYLVKHNFNPKAMSKATGEASTSVPSFKYAQFYEFNSGSYQYKRAYVTNARQRDLRPFKHSYTSFDWCSNQYREVAFRPDGSVRRLMRSDDYGNSRSEYDYRANAYPAAEVPLLVRGLDFSNQPRRAFSVVHGDGTYTGAEAELVSTDTVETPAGAQAAQKIRVRYDKPVPSVLGGEQSAAEEFYWRGTGPQRVLLKIASANGRYQAELIEQIRSPYWQENIFKQLKRVQERP